MNLRAKVFHEIILLIFQDSVYILSETRLGGVFEQDYTGLYEKSQIDNLIESNPPLTWDSEFVVKKKISDEKTEWDYRNCCSDLRWGW